MPESAEHDHAVELLRAILAHWAAKRGNMQVARNLAIRWDEDEPRIGVDPDVCVLAPPPPRDEGLRSVRTWVEGHAAPVLAVEVVSETNPHKDYVVTPDKYAASGTRELWIFDPLLAGPNSHGGPFRLQIWQRDEQGSFVRAYAGPGPARSEVLRAHAVVVADGLELRVADDAAGTELWPTEAEAERAAKEAALARVAELEAELRRRGGR